MFGIIRKLSKLATKITIHFLNTSVLRVCAAIYNFINKMFFFYITSIIVRYARIKGSLYYNIVLHRECAHTHPHRHYNVAPFLIS